MRSVIWVFALVGCAVSNEEPETVYDPCSPLTLSLDADASAEEIAGVEAAIAVWSERLPVQMTVGMGASLHDADGARATNVLPIRFTSSSALRAVYWDATGMISIHREHLAANDFGLAIAHEMGHAFGLPHVDPIERLSVMNIGNLEILPTEVDAAQLFARWTSCSPE